MSQEQNPHEDDKQEQTEKNVQPSDNLSEDELDNITGGGSSLFITNPAVDRSLTQSPIQLNGYVDKH
jgi:bacteriocin-like protein